MKDFVSDGNTLSYAGTALGHLLYPGYGGAVGAFLGQAVGDGMRYFTGRGDYTVKTNGLLNPANPQMPPIVNPSSGGFTVRRSEYIADVISSPTPNTFSLKSYPINPGFDGTFTWLSQIAANYDEWVCEGMYFEYRSMSADALNSTNTALGQVILAANYNTSDPAFTSKQAMEQYEGGISVKPSESVRYFVECAKSQSVLDELYVRTGAIGPNEDIRFYDIANFQIATNGLQGASVNCGELWVSYQITLRKPKLFVAFGEYTGFNITHFSAINSNFPLGGIRTLEPTNTITMEVTDDHIRFYSAPIGFSYLLVIDWTGASGAIGQPTLTFGTGVEGNVRFLSPGVSATAETNMVLGFTMFCPANSETNTVTFSHTGVYPPSCIGRIWAVQLPNTFLGH